MDATQGANHSTKRGYTVAESATYLGVSPAMVRDLIRDSKLSARKFGTRLIVDRAELDRFFEGQPEA